MRSLTSLSILSAVVCVSALFGGVAAEDVVAPRVRRPAPIKPAPLAPPIQAAYQLTVQPQPKFPAQPRPDTAQVNPGKGLSVSVQPERKAFAAQGPLAVEVVLKNTSDRSFMLYNVASLGTGARLIVANQQTGGQWTVSANVAGPRGGTSTELAPGKTLTYSVVVNPIAGPVPFPRPVPLQPQVFPRRAPLENGKKQLDQAPVNRRRPLVIAPAPVAMVLPCGPGTARARLLLQFVANPGRQRFAAPHWTGRIATGVVEFIVDKPGVQPVPPVVNPPVVGPPVGPLTKEQAIGLAKLAAERALSAAYKSSNQPNRPPPPAVWIANPQKTAVAEQAKGGGWTISWSHFPKGGFSYRVKLNVNAGRGVTLSEVFASHSSR